MSEGGGPNYWGGDFEGKPEVTPVASSEDSIYSAAGAFPGQAESVQMPDVAERQGAIEKRNEALRRSEQAVRAGSFLDIIDMVDIYKCQYMEAGGGIYQVVRDGAVVGYAKEPILGEPGEVTLN